MPWLLPFDFRHSQYLSHNNQRQDLRQLPQRRYFPGHRTGPGQYGQVRSCHAHSASNCSAAFTADGCGRTSCVRGLLGSRLVSKFMSKDDSSCTRQYVQLVVSKTWECDSLALDRNSVQLSWLDSAIIVNMSRSTRAPLPVNEFIYAIFMSKSQSTTK